MLKASECKNYVTISAEGEFTVQSQGDAILLASDGINARIKSKTSMPSGSTRTTSGGGGKTGSMSGSINNETVRQSSTRKDSALKYLEQKTLPPCSLHSVLELIANLSPFPVLPPIGASRELSLLMDLQRIE